MECFLCCLLGNRVISGPACVVVYMGWRCIGHVAMKEEIKPGEIPKNRVMSADGSLGVAQQSLVITEK